MSALRIALACMTPTPDGGELDGATLPSYGIRRVLAAVAGDPALAHARIAVVDFARPDPQAYVDTLLQFEPDLVGFSIYVWSTPCLVEVARRIKRARPACAVVFGGPSARRELFDLPAYAPAHDYMDALVSSEVSAAPHSQNRQDMGHPR